MPQTVEQLDPSSLVARIIAELNENPVAQRMLLRAMLTNEFLGMPAHLDAIAADVAEIKGRLIGVESRFTGVEDRFTGVEDRLTGVEDRLTNVEEDMVEVKGRLTNVEQDVAVLKGDSLEVKLPRRIRPYLSQKMGLRRARIMQSAVSIDAEPEMRDPIYDAVDDGVITPSQETRLAATDLVLRAQRQIDRTTVWVAVEASSVINARDIERARASADALESVFAERSIAAVMGYSIREEDRRLASSIDVEVFTLEEER